MSFIGNRCSDFYMDKYGIPTCATPIFTTELFSLVTYIQLFLNDCYSKSKGLVDLFLGHISIQK